MPNVFADTHNYPAAPAPHAPSESVPILYAVRASGSRLPARAGETLVERVDRFIEEATEALRLVGATCAALGCSPADLVSAAAKARVDSDRLSKIRAALGL